MRPLQKPRARMVICGSGPNLDDDHWGGRRRKLVFPIQIVSIILPIQATSHPFSESDSWVPHLAHVAVANDGSRQSFFFVSMAQIARAILLAKAIATSIFSFLPSIRASHDPSGMALRSSQANRDIAAMISNWRISTCPAFETRPSRSLPPVERCRGTSPSQAAKFRPRLSWPWQGRRPRRQALLSGRPLASSATSCRIRFGRHLLDLFQFGFDPNCLLADLRQKIPAFLREGGEALLVVAVDGFASAARSRKSSGLFRCFVSAGVSAIPVPPISPEQ